VRKRAYIWGVLKAESLICPRPAGLYCPPGDFYIDPVRPVARAVITHGHADHARAEMQGRELAMGAMATLDFRIDYVRPARPGMAVTAKAECVKIDGDLAFLRGAAFETDPDDPIALVQAAFMLSSPMAGA
jgi:hypothetical protein